MNPERRNALANSKDAAWGFAAAYQARSSSNGWPLAVLEAAARRHADRIIVRNAMAHPCAS